MIHNIFTHHERKNFRNLAPEARREVSPARKRWESFKKSRAPEPGSPADTFFVCWGGGRGGTAFLSRTKEDPPARYKSRRELTRALRLIARADFALRTNPPSKRLVLENLVLTLTAAEQVPVATWEQQELGVF